jgi:hypothetical protein
MKKVLVIPLLALVVLPFAFAGIDDKPTVISGIIYNQDKNHFVDGALVSVNCNSYKAAAYSSSDGRYGVVVPTSARCVEGDKVLVTATYGNLTGTNDGRVHDYGLVVNVAVVDIFMTPEFGAFAGVLTLVAGVAIFFVVRRE